MQEIWKDIEGYEGLYQVSNLGRVKSFKFGKEQILKLEKIKRGYLRVKLCKDGKLKRFLIHRLVATEFIPNPDNLPQVNHKDEDKTNNRVDNLEWCSNEYNHNYGTRIQRIIENTTNNPKKSKKVLCIETGVVYPSSKQVERELGYAQSYISATCLGKHKTAHGLHWRYID